MISTATRRLRRVTAAVALLVTAAVTLSGCLYAAIPPATSAERPPAPTDLQGYYDQEIVWETCGAYECADVYTPLDWDAPEERAIDLAIVRHRASSGTAIGSLLTNPGGPGGSGVEFLKTSLDYMASERVIDNFDVIGFDPRGVGESTAVRCLDAEGMDEFLYGIGDAERGTPEWEQEARDGAQVFSDACEANSDGILEHITTEASARDMELLRIVLGDDELYYMGFSYGTFLGATYAKLFPETVGRLVLDGAIDPAASGEEVGTTQAMGFERTLRAYMADCLAGSDCPFRGSVDDAMSDLGALLAAVDRTPLTATDGRRLGADSLMTAIIYPLYVAGGWGALTQMLTATLEGDADIAFALADGYNGRENGEYLDNSTEAFYAYNCMDYPVEDTDLDAAEARLAEVAPTIAPFWTGPDLCETWPYPPSGTRGAITADGAAPILVVGTTGDPATPYEWAVALADQLSSGVLLTNEGEGHTSIGSAGECVRTAIDDYLVEGLVPVEAACS